MMQVEISGERDLVQALKELTNSAKGKISMEAIVTALTPVVEAAKSFARASRDTGNLYNSIGFRTKAYPRRGRVVAVIGPRRGFRVVDRFGRTRNATTYGHLIEFGYMGPSGKHVAAKPYMRPAFESTHGEALQSMANVFRQQIEMVVKRRARKRA